MVLNRIKLKTSLILPLSLLFFAIYSSFLIHQTIKMNDDHLVRLANQFLNSNLWLSPINLPGGDYVDYFGNIYLYFGPFSSILLMPFVLFFGKNFPQEIIGITALIISFLAVYLISKSFKFNKTDSLMLAIFFVFSTVLFSVGILNITAYQVQALGAMLILLSLVEYFTKKRFLLIGIYLAFAGLTRLTLYLSILFYIVEALKTKNKLKQLFFLFLPVILSLILLGAYNYKRFHLVFETGYGYNITLKTYPMSSNAEFGLLSVTHIPANLYSLLLKGPEPLRNEKGAFILKFPYLKVDPWGLAIWYTSPLSLFLLIKPKKSEYTVGALITLVVLLVPSLLYFGIGFSQFGYRYSLDFLPFLFILLLPSLLPSLSRSAKILIAVGVLFNCIYLTSLWEVYPHFNVLLR